MVKDQYKPIFDLYTGYHDAAVASFTTAASGGNKAELESAMNNLMKAEEVGNYIYSKKWALSEVDTALVLNIGKAALNAGNKEQAMKYFKRLADANIAGTKEGNVGYNLPYQWLALQYKEAGDSANLLKYANMGKQYFPTDDYFDLILLDYYRSKKDYESLF